ncbi:hypothetical protein Tco_1471126 [Tanacetum coccineum]
MANGGSSSSVDGARSSSVGGLGSLVVRSLSNASFQHDHHFPSFVSKKNGASSSKMFVNNKESGYNVFVWLVKLAPRKKLGMLLLSVASFAAMLWILFIARVRCCNSVVNPSFSTLRHVVHYGWSDHMTNYLKRMV